jgi:hypothetical protein
MISKHDTMILAAAMCVATFPAITLAGSQA